MKQRTFPILAVLLLAAALSGCQSTAAGDSAGLSIHFIDPGQTSSALLLCGGKVFQRHEQHLRDLRAGPERRNAVDTRQKCIRQLIIKADFAARVALTITAAVDQVGCCQLQSALLPRFAQNSGLRRFAWVDMSGRGQVEPTRK